MAACDAVTPPSLRHCENDEADVDVAQDGARDGARDVAQDGALTLPVDLVDAPALARLSLPSRPHQHHHLPPSPPETATGRPDVSVPSSTPPPASSSSSSSSGAGRGSLVSALSAPSLLAPSLLDAASTPRERPHSTARKPSPGLAARLRALGFGSSTKKPSTSATLRSDSVGRLDEHQLRQLHDKLRAASPLGAVVSKRGRPWKGPGESPTTPILSPSSALDDSPSTMDPLKYRLPEHTNGNGTKTTLDMRREFMGRTDVRPPSPEDDLPPYPPPKDTPPASADVASSDYVPGLSSYFNSGRDRPVSIYTLSRASFANQLAQLTSLQLPDAESLSSKVSSIRNAHVAAKALINAAEQIRSWIFKANDVIGGLDGEDDVEWAAAGGREGLEEVENAISRFGHLINVYVGAIEELQAREDITSVLSDDLRTAVSQMETILDEWCKIRATLYGVRTQVEIAMEWEELWNSVLGDIQSEMDELSCLVFEMEERRHKTVTDAVDMGDLETIVEDSPTGAAPRLHAANRANLAGLALSPTAPSSPSLSHDDSSLLALFARMQPLRASLDFLPMRLSVFEARAERSFPTACEELEMRRNGLDASYKKLEKDAESLRKELGEDRWVIVFRGAGRQAQKMLESVQRSLQKLREALDGGLQLSSPAATIKKIESYEAKKLHYGPAIERVLSIIEKGVRDRLTVNGEILRLHADTQSRWEALKARIADMDAVLDDMPADRKGQQQLRDSVSSLLSMDRSTLGSGHETPGSSPPSSVIMSSLGLDPHTPMAKAKGLSPVGGTHSTGRRRSPPPAATSQQPRRTGVRLSTMAGASMAITSSPSSRSPRPGSSVLHRPRWNTSTTISRLDTNVNNLSPLSAATPSPYSRSTPGGLRSVSALSPPTAGSRLPAPRSALMRAASESPSVRETLGRPTSHSRLGIRDSVASPASSLASPGPYSQHFISRPRALLSKSSMSALTPKRRSNAKEGAPVNRPASSLALTSRRNSMLPLPKDKPPESSAGRTSSRMSSTSRCSTRKADGKDARPKWRP
ncbi:hypothetical protein XA68_12887 [Ophiocordyceps unilateralis]|uniref:Karyogamy protein n=1 Tax=Ophiocordyceps unilateralis TaxID=268505 RepID=A0A2A9PCA2_OPHUN|nr:hypothetical protein XA68_12887 [Ophiocordyceps unilateralis]